MDPLTYFGKLVDDPKLLLRTMLDLKMICSGSRAAEYFVPGSCDPTTSDWDFYVEGYWNYCMQYHVNKYVITGAAKIFKDVFGVKWNTSHVDSESVLMTDNTDYGEFKSIKGILTKSDGSENIVNLIFTNASSPYEAVVKFHSTPVQCFITGAYAVHFNGSLSLNKNMKVWEYNNQHQISCATSTEARFHRKSVLHACIEKYVSRGYMKVDNQWYLENTKGWKEVGCADNPGKSLVRTRYIGDDDTTLIRFKVSGDEGNQPMIEFRWFETLNYTSSSSVMMMLVGGVIVASLYQ